MTTTYAYDAFNRRVSKTVGGVATYFVHDGQDIVEERDAAGVLKADYVYGPLVDEPLTMTRGGVTYYYFTDGLGSVRNLTNSAGTIVESYDYDAYGKPTTTSTVGNPIMFTGRWYDAESGNYYYRARQYSPTIGRFLQRDPWGYWDSMNLFAYVVNNPVNWTDALGLGRFGYRPLGGTPWNHPDSRSGDGNPQDRHNREPYHEQYWGDDGWNMGYGPQGTKPEPDSERSQYTMHGPEYDDPTMEQAYKNIMGDPENQGGAYCFAGSGHNNCQDFADRMRQEYDRLMKQKEEQNQQCSAGGNK